MVKRWDCNSCSVGSKATDLLKGLLADLGERREERGRKEGEILRRGKVLDLRMITFVSEIGKGRGVGRDRESIDTGTSGRVGKTIFGAVVDSIIFEVRSINEGDDSMVELVEIGENNADRGGESGSI